MIRSTAPHNIPTDLRTVAPTIAPSAERVRILNIDQTAGLMVAIVDLAAPPVTTETAAVPVAPHGHHDFIFPMASSGSVFVWGNRGDAEVLLLTEGEYLP